MTNWLIAEFSVLKTNPQALDKAISFMDNSKSRGFILFYEDEQPESDYLYLLDYLKERVLEQGYRNYMSDIKSYTKNDAVETIQRHYLKPEPSFEPPIDQVFGNVTIELVFTNDKTKLLRLSATPYPDRLYSKPRAFSKLIYSLE